MSQDDLRVRAQKRVEEKKGFYTHFGIYGACALFFFLLNVLTGGWHGAWWFFYPVLGWGLGVAVHYISIFGLPGTNISNLEWEDRQIEKEMVHLQRQKQSDTDSLPPPNDDLELDDLELKEKEPLKNRWDDNELV